ncbi:hypothetical protein HZH66_001370 [Vespula vulgaris]|uniref:Uncharacterized protein n=1 Tax=Vespula vulgaris TaxID=7454 RepID=A0A834NLK3_VESVU|nr:hypothetical protein HZH66_001370 [Vespula vulgaris]
MKEEKKEPREEKPKRSESSLSAESPNGVQENVEAKGERTYLRSRVVIELDPFLKLKDNGSSTLASFSPFYRCGAAWCGAMRCGAVRCGAVRCDTPRTQGYNGNFSRHVPPAAPPFHLQHDTLREGRRVDGWWCWKRGGEKDARGDARG